MEAKRKIGRPATGISESRKVRVMEINEAYIGCREQGMTLDQALDELASREWGLNIPELFEEQKYYSREVIRKAIAESRSIGITDDDFRLSRRLQKVTDWKTVFEIDPVTGEVKPKN